MNNISDFVLDYDYGVSERDEKCAICLETFVPSSFVRFVPFVEHFVWKKLFYFFFVDAVVLIL